MAICSLSYWLTLQPSVEIQNVCIELKLVKACRPVRSPSSGRATAGKAKRRATCTASVLHPDLHHPRRVTREPSCLAGGLRIGRHAETPLPWFRNSCVTVVCTARGDEEKLK